MNTNISRNGLTEKASRQLDNIIEYFQKNGCKPLYITTKHGTGFLINPVNNVDNDLDNCHHISLTEEYNDTTKEPEDYFITKTYHLYDNIGAGEALRRIADIIADYDETLKDRNNN